jgi:tight adherence protein C
MDALGSLADGAAALVRTHALSVVSVLVLASVVFALAAAATGFGGRTDPVRRRLVKAASRRGAVVPAASIRFRDDRFDWFDRFALLYRYFLPTDENRLRVAGRSLVQAGYRTRNAVARYYGLRVVLAGGLFVGASVLAMVIVGGAEPRTILLAATAAAAAGYFLPAVYLGRRLAARQRLIAEGFPDALDMLLVCVEAGLGLDAAIAKVAAEIGPAHPIIGDELSLTGLELQAGRGREDALRDLGQRTGVEDVRALVTLLVQSDALGTSIGQALRVHSFEMRTKRLLQAEEAAHKIPVKLAVPLVFGLLPCLMAVVLAPAIIKAVSFGFPVLSHGLTGPGG